MSNITCQTFIEWNGFEYICASKVSFITLVAAIAFIVTIILTVVGNTLVILVILKDKKHQTPSNYLILSLAVTDLIVGLITVPIRGVNEIKDYGTWPYGAFWCDFRVVIDRVCVNASIFHLLAIAVDRYLSVTSFKYSITRNNKRILVMIFFAWFLAFWLAIAAPLGWRDNKYNERIRRKICLVSTDFSLNLTVWIVVFVIPVFIMVILYARMYQIAKTALRRKSVGVNDLQSLGLQTESSSNGTSTTNDSSVSDKYSNSDISVVTISTVGTSDEERQRQSAEEKRERKVAKTLFIITGCVFVCWLPFFSYYTLATIFGVKFATNSNLIFKITIWLGYLNSLLNPFIYAVTNPYYRLGFKKLLRMRGHHS